MSAQDRVAADGLPPLGAVIRAHGLAARKALGQNFLLDLNLTGRIARAAGDLSQTHVLEIGPGPGGLTRALLHAGAAHVTAIERDARCLPALAEIAAHWQDRLTVIEGDALRLDPAALSPAPQAVVANLPYNIGTELLTRWLSADWPPWWRSLTLMFQREVAQRIVAKPRDDAYGRLAVLAGWRTQAQILFDVPAAAFTPPPKVMSSVIFVTPLLEPVAPARLQTLSRVTAAAFGQRRKMLRQSLKGASPYAPQALEVAGVDPTSRAETLSIAQFCALARAIDAMAG
jgi:16S rRNA (adenine1518-N6/adenine1519-N6)-dimethyltransferase